MIRSFYLVNGEWTTKPPKDPYPVGRDIADDAHPDKVEAEWSIPADVVRKARREAGVPENGTDTYSEPPVVASADEKEAHKKKGKKKKAG